MDYHKNFIYLAILLGLFYIGTTVDNRIFDPKIYINQELPESRKETPRRQFSLKFPDENYEIMGEVYQGSGILDGKNLYNLSNYQKSRSCFYYKSIIKMTPVHGERLNYTIYQGIFSSETQQLYVVGLQEENANPEKFIDIYKMKKSQLEFQQRINLKELSLDISIASNIYLQKIDSYILLTDGEVLYRLEDKTSQKITLEQIKGFSQVPSKERIFLGLNRFFYDKKELLLVLYNSNIVIYEYNKKNGQINNYMSLESQNTGEEFSFQDVEIDTPSGTMFILMGNQLNMYKLQNPGSPKQYELDGDFCSRIFSNRLTLHIVCQYQRKTFVAEYSFTPQDELLLLNRYYNDLQNYRSINYFDGFMLMVAENEIVIRSQATNRKVIIDLPKEPYLERFVSFGLQSLFPVINPQKKHDTETVVSMGQNFLGVLELSRVPAEIWCQIYEQPESMLTNILVVRNTSQCQKNSNKPLLESVCINLKPLIITFEPYELQKKVTLILAILIVVLVVVVAFLCLGCVFRENLSYNTLLRDIRKKVDQIKSSKSKELKEI